MWCVFGNSSETFGIRIMDQNYIHIVRVGLKFRLKQQQQKNEQ